MTYLIFCLILFVSSFALYGFADKQERKGLFLTLACLFPFALGFLMCIPFAIIQGGGFGGWLYIYAMGWVAFGLIGVFLGSVYFFFKRRGL